MRPIVFIVTILLTATCSANAAEPLIKVQTLEQKFEGRTVYHDALRCQILQRDGQLVEVAFDDITEFDVIAPEFRPYSAVELRSRLRREFGPEYEIVGSSRYLVVAPPGSAQDYADLFELLNQQLRSYLSVRNFPITEPEFPLVAIVFPDVQKFWEYAKQDGVPPTQGLAGYYQRSTNRVALFDPDSKVTSHSVKPTQLVPENIFARTSVSANLKDTIIHEATHQVAFNIGLHSRYGTTPKWVVEGLATVFENELMRGSARHSSVRQKINVERFVWFGNYIQHRRKMGSLPSFINSDSLFQRQTLDAYSEAWALTFYLMETRSSQYAQYLKQLKERSSQADYSAADRQADFEDFFQCKLDKLELDMIRFYAQIQ